ncbi:MAG: hypothetical protein V4595_05160 [Pseudomonadota bacterium]
MRKIIVQPRLSNALCDPVTSAYRMHHPVCRSRAQILDASAVPSCCRAWRQHGVEWMADHRRAVVGERLRCLRVVGVVADVDGVAHAVAVEDRVGAACNDTWSAGMTLGVSSTMRPRSMASVLFVMPSG